MSDGCAGLAAGRDIVARRLSRRGDVAACRTNRPQLSRPAGSSATRVSSRKTALALPLLLKSHSACPNQKQRRSHEDVDPENGWYALAPRRWRLFAASPARADETVATNVKVPFAFIVGRRAPACRGIRRA